MATVLFFQHYCGFEIVQKKVKKYILLESINGIKENINRTILI